MRKVKRKKELSPNAKIHTSIYLIPRHKAYLEQIMDLTGMSMTACISKLIDESMPTKIKSLLSMPDMSVGQE
jgi:hypothetical protein